MESAIVHLEQSVEKADGKLDMIAWQIDAFEKEFQDSESEPISVLQLLRSVTQVKEEYQVLRQDIREVLQLQKQLTESVRAQLLQVHGHFNILRNRIIGHNRTPQLK
ncbi:PREDICTED: uncharacterized protein LOC105363383 [Ceratosolen solmsi marchali]|uniref:Uncharacterized protein LOC105363383 n=1 Tax=Ceratosolen solmsi marchali TaxID=326594 RepID=A0AAJ6YJQ5_9HYME|nr:PREDICTED: uncharacterized protein LOC105363383 [Ceratosolen solmsi marchali]